MQDISYTALLTMYPRIFTDIPFSKLIYELVLSLLNSHGYRLISIEDKKPFLAPELEYRYKLIDKLIDSSSFDVIVEIGSGFSTRGLIYSNKNINYLEIELDEICCIKKNIYHEILKRNCSNITHIPKIFSGNILDDTTWDRINDYIRNKKVLFINEGLLRYLKKDQKTYVGNHISDSIKKTGGKWITADVTLRNLIKLQQNIIFKKDCEIDRFVAKSSHDYSFATLKEAEMFFSKITNMRVVVHNTSCNILKSRQALGLTADEVKKLTEYVYVFEMK